LVSDLWSLGLFLEHGSIRQILHSVIFIHILLGAFKLLWRVGISLRCKKRKLVIKSKHCDVSLDGVIGGVTSLKIVKLTPLKLDEFLDDVL
jgi:hypothetical protein